MSRRLFVVFILGIQLLLPAENLIFNGRFELGTAGFALHRVLRVDTNPGGQFLPLLAEDGKLVIDNRFGEYFRLHSQEFSAAPGVYTLRMRAKSTTPQKMILVVFNASGSEEKIIWPKCRHLSPRLLPEMQTLTWEYALPESYDGNFNLELRTENRNIPAARITIESLELFQGKDSSEGVEIALDTPEFLYDHGAKVPLQIKAVNHEKKSYQQKVKFFVRDDFFNQVAETRILDVKLAPGEKKTFQMELNASRYGAFDVTCNAPGIKGVQNGAFTVIGRYVAKKLDFNREFCVGINGGLEYYGPPTYENYGYYVWNAPVERRLEQLARMGCRLIREHGGGYESTTWGMLESAPGKWDFSFLDHSLNLYGKYYITPFPCLGRISFLYRDFDRRLALSFWPEWVKPLRLITEHPAYNWRSVHGHIKLPPVELWERYVEQVASHAGKRITHYEIFNEPNGVMSAEDYFPYCQAAYRAIKKGNPAAKVVGLSVTSDFQAISDAFMQRFLQLGGAEWIDIAGFHPYLGRQLSSAVAADDYIANLRNCLAVSGKVIPLWNTELYYLFDRKYSNRDYLQIGVRAHHAATRFLTDLGEGVGQSTAVHVNQLWKSRLRPKLRKYSVQAMVEQIPGSTFVAYNFLARTLEGASPLFKRKISPGVIFYAYRTRDGKAVATVWNYSGISGISADLGAFEITDLFGNRLAAGSRELTGYPQFLFPRSGAADDFLERLERIRLSVRKPLRFSPVARLVSNDLLISCHNIGGDSESGRLEIASAGLKLVAPFRFHLLPGEGALWKLPVKRVGNEQIGKLRVRLVSKKNSEEEEVQLVQNPGTDAGTKVVMNQAEWKLSRRNGRVHVFVKVKDTTPFQPKLKCEPYWQDGVELFFDPAPEKMPLEEPEKYHRSVYQMFLLPRVEQADAAVITRPVLPKSDIQFHRQLLPNGYQLEISLPERRFFSSGMIGFAVKVNDIMPDGRRKESSWGGKSLSQNRLSFGIVYAKKEKQK